MLDTRSSVSSHKGSSLSLSSPILPRLPRTIASISAANHGGLGLTEVGHVLKCGLAHLLDLFVRFLVVYEPLVRCWREGEALCVWKGLATASGPESAKDMIRTWRIGVNGCVVNS